MDNIVAGMKKKLTKWLRGYAKFSIVWENQDWNFLRVIVYFVQNSTI